MTTSLLQNPEAERAVIAALMRDPDPQSIIQLGIAADLFTLPATLEAYNGIVSFLLSGIAPDAATLRAALSDAALLEVETSLAQEKSAANLPVYVKLLKDCQRERAVQAARKRLFLATEAGAPPHELQAILESVRAAGADESGPPRFQWASEFCQNTEPEPDLIDGYIPMNSLGVIFGDSEAYKSFLMIDLCGHIATGRQWRGRDTQQGKVLFIAGEGGSGLKARIQAWFEKYGEQNRDFAVSTVPLELCDPKNAGQLIADIQQFIGNESFKFIVLDTLNTHFGAGDENTTADMTRFRLSALKLSQTTGATVAIAHHCGLQDKNRSRGSISLHNGVDWEYKLERLGDCTTLTPTKMKDGPRPEPLSWRLVPQALPWLTSKRDPINSVVLEPTETSIIAASSSERLPASQRIALDALRTALIDHGTEDKGIVSVAEDQWRKSAYEAGITASDSTQDAKRKAFNRARDNLVAAKKVTCFESRYWIPHNRTKPDISRTCPDMSGGVPDAQTGQNRTHPYKGCPAVRLSGLPGHAQPVPVPADGISSHHPASNPPVDAKKWERL